MKKIGLIIAGIFLSVLFLGAGVWADITIEDTIGPDITYVTSPNVAMDYGVNATTNVDGYYVTSVNSKGTIEYGIASGYSGYYQHAVDVGSGATVPTKVIVGWTKSGDMQ